ncbi:MAG TPA: transporter substrate-binding domain-containing protein, partial [Pseudomonadales bacterium]|nr:transporter substrate-binding domain-containing protein [Pseudomonadales bacterium]
MRQPLMGLLCVLALAANAGARATAAEAPVVAPADAVPRHLVIGTLHSPPFIIHNRDGSWSGISVELWRAIAAELGLTFEFEEHSLQALLDGIREGSLDAAAAALTITEERERHIDFTHPFHTTGFAIATRPGQRTSVWFAVFQQLFSWEFLQVAGALALLLFVVGWIIWLVEHKHRPVQEDSHTIRHISEGFWWAAATMTTVGYGDKTPLTRIGRAFGV